MRQALPGTETSAEIEGALRHLLAEHRGKVRAAATAAGVDPVTLYRLLRKRGVALRRVVDDTAFRTAQISTDMLSRRPELAKGPGDEPDDMALAAAVLCQMVAPAANGRGAGGGTGGGGTIGGSPAAWQEFADYQAFEAKR